MAASAAKSLSIKSRGLESFLTPSHGEPPLFLEILHEPGTPGEGPAATFTASRRSRQESFLVSLAFHLFIALLAILEPKLLGPSDRSPDESASLEERRRLVLFMEEPPAPGETVPVPAPPLVPVPDEPARERLVIPKATRPAPPDKRGEFQNDLPFSEGNTDEFVTDTESKKPGDEGEPGEKADSESQEESAGDPTTQGSTPGDDQAEKRVAELFPEGRLTFPEPGSPRRVPPSGGVPAPRTGGQRDAGEEGDRGEGGAFEDIRRFLADKRFHNPEGGLVTGLGRTLYYNDKGAEFVPWIRRMLAEVRRNFLMPASALFLGGHVAVGVVVDRSGNVVELKIIIPSGVAGFDNSAVGSLQAADLLPLPRDYPDERFEFILVFWINEQPYELF